ncbi:phage antirepressor [Lacticaseibacillus paracasei]|uniref:phage antirepressor n=1 Tax=Lacticaseibacillus paracasei TaxID=1597 RepID=UPI002F26BC74
MNELQEFNFQGNQLRTVLIDSEPFFVGKDAATAIGYKNFRDALKTHVKAKYKRESRITTPFGTQTMTVISEPGLYQLAGESKLPSADPFQDWVYEQVLPSIRKHGAYMTPETIEQAIYNPDFIINLATKLKDEQAKTAALTADNETMKPKALFADAVATSHTSILIGDLAKLIRQNGVDIGQNRLFAWLREHGYLIGSGDRRNMPTQRAMDLGLFDIKERTFQNPDGSVRITKTTKVTGKGQQYFINKFLQKGDI